MKEFPAKVKELDELAGSKKWSLSRLEEIHEEAKITVGGALDGGSVQVGTKRKRADDGGQFYKMFYVIAFSLDAVPVNGQDAKLPCNKWIVELVDDIKPEISELMGKLIWNILSPNLF